MECTTAIVTSRNNCISWLWVVRVRVLLLQALRWWSSLSLAAVDDDDDGRNSRDRTRFPGSDRCRGAQWSDRDRMGRDMNQNRVRAMMDHGLDTEGGHGHGDDDRDCGHDPVRPLAWAWAVALVVDPSMYFDRQRCRSLAGCPCRPMMAAAMLEQWEYDREQRFLHRRHRLMPYYWRFDCRMKREYLGWQVPRMMGNRRGRPMVAAGSCYR